MDGSLQSSILWDFTVAMQGNVSRYGHLGVEFYKQYNPAGLEFSTRYPPHRISHQQYEFAKRIKEKGD
jgi:hypothetical protein